MSSAFDSNSDKPLFYVWVCCCFTVVCVAAMYYFTYGYRCIMYEMENVTFATFRIFFNILANPHKYSPFRLFQKRSKVLVGSQNKVNADKEKQCFSFFLRDRFLQRDREVAQNRNQTELTNIINPKRERERETQIIAQIIEDTRETQLALNAS